MNKPLYTTVLTIGIVAPIAMYVPGYFPPDKQGERHPDHGHVEASTSGNASLSGGVVIRSTFASTSALRWTIQS